jgi:hypothetical protein
MGKYMIGERVIYQNVVCTICRPEYKESSFDVWIDNPERGYKHGVDEANLTPLAKTIKSLTEEVKRLRMERDAALFRESEMVNKENDAILMAQALSDLNNLVGEIPEVKQAMITVGRVVADYQHLSATQQPNPPACCYCDREINPLLDEWHWLPSGTRAAHDKCAPTKPTQQEG